MELTWAKAMVSKAFDNDMVRGRTLKVFRTYKRKLRKGSNARKRVVSISEYLDLMSVAPSHLKDILVLAYNTGMRTGEIRHLQWSHVDMESGFIRLPAEVTKETRDKKSSCEKGIANMALS